ncbi:hypothetical protein ABIA32_005367 [Streptacidiphilus sp. MAP12-20]|uniref:SRPBCC family protein n=1 Tax=Streptacidiphilus sp. MAP12-20 TaxID=3156299 RepID=UPI0035176B4B
MAQFRLSRTVPLSATESWQRLTDWPRHGERVPLTRVFVAVGSGRAVGDLVVARTRLGRVGFDDTMEVTVFQPPGPDRPGRCRLVKRGSLVRGWAELTVSMSGSVGSAEVGWREELRVAHLPRTADPLVAAAGRWVFGRALDGLLGGTGSADR